MSVSSMVGAVLYFYFYFLTMPCGLQNLSSLPGIKHMPPAVECRVLTTGPPGKPRSCAFLLLLFKYLFIWLCRVLWHVGSRSWTRDQTRASCTGSPNHWTTREVHRSRTLEQELVAQKPAGYQAWMPGWGSPCLGPLGVSLYALHF